MFAARRIVGLSAAAYFAAALIAAPPDPGPDDALLRRAQIGNGNADLLDYFRRRIVSEVERTRILDLIQQLGDDAYAVRERSGAELIEIGLPAIGLLRQNQTNADVEIARRCELCLTRIERGVPFPALSAAVARQIAARKPPGAAGVLLGSLPFADDETVADEMREALAAVAVVEGRIDPALTGALGDSSPDRRAAAAEALIRSGLPAGIEAGRKSLSDAVADVRLRTAAAMVTAAKDRNAVPILINLLGELPMSTAWRVEEVLIRLAGDQGPRVSLGRDESARQKCRDAWLGWWKDHGDKIDLSKLDSTPPTLGYTLVVVRDRNGTSGKVMEFNAAQDLLWSIAGLQMPMDAVVIGKDRVLIAEHIANRVSERDLRGTVIWSKTVELPYSAQRLPNGNTFVVCRNSIAEWNPDRSVIYSYSRPQHDIIAAAKLRDGEIVFLTNQGTCVRLNRERKEIKSFQTGPRNILPFGGLDVSPDGNVILTLRDSVAEFDRDGNQKWSVPVSRPTAVQRLANGNTLATTTGALKVVELDPSGKLVWEHRFADGSIPYRVRRR